MPPRLVLRITTAIAVLLVTPTARADDPIAPPAPDIAPPAPDAPPKKVEEAKEVAKSAQLTPIVPNPNDATHPAFLLYAEIDPPLLATGAVFAFARVYKTQPAFCAPACDSVKLNALDKLTAGYYSAAWSTTSDYLLYGLGAATAATLIADEGVLDTLNDGVVIGEATLSATAVASIMTLAAGRPRPFLYGDPKAPAGYKAPLGIRNSGDAGLSFLSSHTAEAFAMVTSLYVAEHRLHPRSSFPRYVLGVGLAVASTIGVARVMSGYHFITDVIGGAVVGSSVGVLVASVHSSPVHVVPVVDHKPEGSAAGLALSGGF
ncbi:MAG TPA: phosphatase PAP2 family protein [Kofleriaceae bacterium]|nr:phosphatase PAP2 family protein [Kofleriaceae bacterium]